MRDVRGAASVEAITNCGSTTGFLPNFVRFPSLRGPHSSTVQRRQVTGVAQRGRCARRRLPPTGAGPDAVSPAELGCPVSAASSASAASARRPAPARGAPSAGVTPTRVMPPSRVTPTRVMAAAGRTATAAVRPGPPAGSPAARAPPAARPGAPAAVRLDEPVAAGPAAPRRHGGHAQHRDHRQDDAPDHGVPLPPSPEPADRAPDRSPGRPPDLPGALLPKRPPVGASQRAREMPGRRTGQSTLEEVQSLDGGWPA